MPRIQFRRSTTAKRASDNPVLAAAEPAVETQTDGTQRFYLGDGSTGWNELDPMPLSVDAAHLTGTLSEARLPDLSGTYVRPADRQGSQLLSQHVPLGGVRVDPFQVRADNATTACVTPTPDGGGQVVEPCVIHFPLGWNGFEYWAVVSSYPNADATKENPSILCSHDGDTWQVPDGLTNPIDAPASGDGYVDGTLVMDGDTMWCVYNTGPFYAMSSTDGVNWTDRISLTISGASATGIGPMLARRGDDYYLWVNTNGTSPYVLKLFKSTTGITGTFEYVSDCTFPAITGRDVWERNVCLVGDQFVAVWGYCLTGTGGADCKQHLAVSTDGIDWTVNPSPLIDRGGAGTIDDNAIYRSTIVPLDGRGGKLFDLWYGAVSGDDTTSTYVFKMARTVIEYDPPVQRGAWRHAPRVVGYHYPPNGVITAASKAQPINKVYAAPCWTDQDIWIDQLAVSVSAAGVGATGRLSIYLPTYPQRPFGDARLQPGATLLLDAGTVDASTTGLKTLDLDTPLKIPAGMFWLAGVAQGAQIGTWCTSSSAPAFSPLGLSGGGMQATPMVAFLNNVLVSGAMPTTLSFALAQRQAQDFGITYRLAAPPTS